MAIEGELRYRGASFRGILVSLEVGETVRLLRRGRERVRRVTELVKVSDRSCFVGLFGSCCKVAPGRFVVCFEDWNSRWWC